jgi:protein transport protein SEC61 subunit alpha
LVIGIAAALGMCGSGGAGNAALVVLQLFAGGVVVVLADLLHETGYGVEGVSAASLLIATNACERAVSHLFSPVKLRLAGAGPEFEGPVFAVTHRVAAAPPSWRHKAGALLFTLLRLDLPNLSNYMTTCVMFVLAVRLDETHLRRLYRSRPRRGTDEFVPIKLLYTSAMPIMLHASAVSAFCVVRLAPAPPPQQRRRRRFRRQPARQVEGRRRRRRLPGGRPRLLRHAAVEAAGGSRPDPRAADP